MGRSPRARERADLCRRLPSNPNTFPPIAQAMGAVKSFCPAFFKKREKSASAQPELCGGALLSEKDHSSGMPASAQAVRVASSQTLAWTSPM